MIATGYSATDKGQKRSGNEDFHVVDNRTGVYIVCDGMGGHNAGEVASRLAVERVHRHLRNASPFFDRIAHASESPEVGIRIMAEAIEDACRHLFEHARANLECAGMGTTITALVVAGSYGILGHVGDSRLYVLRRGRVEQITVDHTVGAEMVRAGVMSAERARSMRMAHALTRCVGTQPVVKVDTLALDLLPRDVFLLCSDGLHGYLPRPEDALRLLSGRLSEAPARLVDHANGAGGQDNITALVVQVDLPRDLEDTMPMASSETETRINTVTSLPIFEGLRLAHIQRVLNACDLKEWRKGEILVSRGQRADAMFVVVSGRAEAVDGSGRVAREIAPGETVGELALLDPHVPTHDVVGVTPGSGLLLTRQALVSLAHDRPDLGVMLFARLGGRAARMVRGEL